MPPVQHPGQSSPIQSAQYPGQSGRIPAVAQPYQSGQMPPVQASMPQGYPTRQPQTQPPLPTMPPQPPAQVAGPYAPQQSRRGHSRILRIGIVSAIAAALILAVALVLVFVKPFGLFEEKLEVDRPPVSQVEEAFDEAELPDPDLSAFAYIDDSNLEMSSLDGFEAGEVEYSKSGGSTEAYCEATAEAKYVNQSVSVTQTLTMRMDYDKKAGSWEAGGVRNGSATATPEGPADIDAITADFLNILKAYDPQIAGLYVGAEVTATSTLTKNGGTAAFTATKAEGDTSRTCTANADVEWSDTEGWNVEITSVNGDVAAPEQPAAEGEQPPAESSGETTKPESTSPEGSGGGSGNQGDGATMGLLCFTGDLIEIPGTVHFDNSGAVLLKTDARIRVVLDGATYVTDYFELQGSSFQNGQHLTVIGEISYRGVVPQAPLAINTDYR